MRPHSKAKGNAFTRRLMIHRIEDQGWPVAKAAAMAGCSERTGYKWLRRWRDEGEAGLSDRSCRPRRVAHRTPARRVEAVVRLRRRRQTSWEIARRLRLPWSTVSAILRREGIGRLRLLEPPEPARRYERAHSGELVHFDVKPLARIQRGPGHRVTGDRSRQARGAGWEFVHVAVDDASRWAYAEVLSDQKGVTAVAFLERALREFRKRRLCVRQVLTDNGSCYVSRKFRQACKRHQIGHLRTRPYRPETNGKAERFIQTMLGGWAYKRPFRSSNQRTRALPKWLRYYNERRPHRALGMIAPVARIQRAA